MHHDNGINEKREGHLCHDGQNRNPETTGTYPHYMTEYRKLTDRATAQNKLPSLKIAIEVMKTGFATHIVRTFPKNKTKAALEYD